MNLPDTSFIKEDMKNPKGRIFWRGFVLVFLILNFIALLIGVSSKKGIEFFWVKVKDQDTIILTKTVVKDSIIYVDRYIPIKTESHDPKISQKNAKGSNNAVGGDNLGIMGDNNKGNVYNEHQLTPELENEMLHNILAIRKQYNIRSNKFLIVMMGTSNLSKMASQTQFFLEKIGYLFDGTSLGSDNFNGVQVRPSDDNSEIVIVFGTL